MMSYKLRRASDRDHDTNYRSINANLAALPPGTARPTVSTRKCPRCPLDSSGNRTQHPIGVRCDVKANCEVCLSDQHAKHSCFVAEGVPPGVKLQSDMLSELTRLHQLYKQKQWDGYTTPTTLKWLLVARRKLLDQSAVPTTGGNQNGIVAANYVQRQLEEEYTHAQTMMAEGGLGDFIHEGLATLAVYDRGEEHVASQSNHTLPNW